MPVTVPQLTVKLTQDLAGNRLVFVTFHFLETGTVFPFCPDRPTENGELGN